MGTRSSQRGFTLIEAAVAIAVVAILSGIIIPLVVKNLRDSQISRAKNDVQVIAGAIASQIKDTGRRPQAGAGAGNALWGSGPQAAMVPNVPTGFPALNQATNAFTNLFTPDARNAAALTAVNTIFGFGAATTAQQEFQYRGPYLGTDVAGKLDPWGNRYMIMGYNQNSGAVNGPVWVVCAGPNGSVAGANAAPVPPATWNYGATNSASSDDIVVAVN